MNLMLKSSKMRSGIYVREVEKKSEKSVKKVLRVSSFGQ